MKYELHSPNWEEGVSLTRTHMTRVERGVSAKESRQSLSDRGRWKMTYQLLLLDANESRQLMAWLQSMNEARVYIPLWTDYCEMSGTHLVGSTFLNVTETTDLDFTSSMRAIIWKGILGSETVQLSAVNTNQLTLAAPYLQQNYTLDDSIGLRIYPALYGRLSWEPSEVITDEYIRVQMNFEELVEDAA